MSLLSENGLNAENIWGQGYDSAANMNASYMNASYTSYRPFCKM